MINNGFAFSFEEATLATTGGVEIEQVKFLGQVSTIMRSLTGKDGDLLSCFDNNKDTDGITSMNSISLNHRLINSHSVEIDR